MVLSGVDYSLPETGGFSRRHGICCCHTLQSSGWLPSRSVDGCSQHFSLRVGGTLLSVGGSSNLLGRFHEMGPRRRQGRTGVTGATGDVVGTIILNACCVFGQLAW